MPENLNVIHQRKSCGGGGGVQLNSIQCDVEYYNAIHRNALIIGVMQCSVKQCNSVRCNTVQYIGKTQYNVFLLIQNTPLNHQLRFILTFRYCTFLS